MAASGTAPTEGQNESSGGNVNRVWVGNLSYKISEGELKDVFAEMNISDISLPERFGRRQGYAFITFENATDVEKAVSEVNGKELLGREMRVQKATSSGPYPSENGAHGEATEGESRKARPRFSKRVPRRRRATGQEGETNTKEASPEAATEKAVNPRRRRVQKKTIGDGQASAEADSSDDRKKPSRKALRKGPPEDGIPSTTTIYVANIPFEYTDEKLKELFAAYEPTSAYIVPRHIPKFVVRKLAERGEPRKGRGFGFVTFEDEAAQKRAVEEMNGREVESRPISVKVAIDKPREESKENGNHEASVAANGST